MPQDHDMELPRGTRVPKSKTVHIPVTEDQFRRLRDLANGRHTTVAELLRFACWRSGLFIDEEPTDDQKTHT